MANNGANNHEAATIPATLGDFPSIKSRWVVMQHSKKNNLNDLASVPDFDLLDAGWLDVPPAGPVEASGKPSLLSKKEQQQPYELIVTQAERQGDQGLGASGGAGAGAKDGVLETILNQDVETDVAPPPPAPLFRDDEMESWLLSTLDEPAPPTDAAPPRQLAHDGDEDKKGAAGVAGRSSGPARQGPGAGTDIGAKIQGMERRSPLAQPIEAQEHPQGGEKRGASPSLQQLQQQLNMQRMQQRLKQQLQQQQGFVGDQDGALLQRQEAGVDSGALEHGEPATEEDKTQSEAQLSSHAQLLQRQMLQQQSQHLGEEQLPGARQGTAQRAPLNFSHFSRPAHLYRSANLKSIGQGPARSNTAPAQQQEQQGAQGSLGRTSTAPAVSSSSTLPKLPAALVAKYASASALSSAADSGRAALAEPSGRGLTPVADPLGRKAGDAGAHLDVAAKAPALPATGEGISLPRLPAAGVSTAAMAPRPAGSQRGAYAPLMVEHVERKEGVGSQDVHTSTVTSTPPREKPAPQLPKPEKETTVCSGLGNRRDLGVFGVGGGAVDFSSRSTGSRLLKRAHENETEYTVSEAVPEDSEDTRKTGKKPGEGSIGGGTSAAKRARAAEVHNMSERRRRDRINERMRMLQELIPNSNKTDKASMLDEAIEYLKMLQLQLQVMSMRSGMSIPANLVPGASGIGSTFPGVAGSSSLSQLPLGSPADMPALSGSGLMGEQPPGHVGALGGLAPMGSAVGARMGQLGVADPGMPGRGDLASDMGPYMLGDECAGMGPLGVSPALGEREFSGLPARQRLLMEMVQADLAAQQQEQQQLLLQQQHQQKMLLQQQGAGATMGAAVGALGRGPAVLRGGAGGAAGLPMALPPKPEPVTRASTLLHQMGAPAAAGGAYGLAGLRGGLAPTASGLSGNSLGERLPSGKSVGAMAAAAVMLEGHRQLNPSAVDPLDVYLARHQHMQRQQQQQEEHKQQQQAAVDYQMYQAILKRQNQTM